MPELAPIIPHWSIEVAEVPPMSADVSMPPKPQQAVYLCLHLQKQSDFGTRGSKLAMWQNNWVKAELEKHGCDVELIQIKTQGVQVAEELIYNGAGKLLAAAKS